MCGSHGASLEGDAATSLHYGRVMHMVKGAHQGKTYESWIEYSDALIRTPEGWRSRRRDGRVIMDQGDRSLLGPG